MTTIAATTNAWKTNEARQLMALVMRPPMSGPAAAPMPAAALTMPKDRAREGRSVKATVMMM